MIKYTWQYIFEQRYLLTKYVTVGALTAVLDFSLLYILTDIVGFHYLVSATISFIVAATTNYSFNRSWTFKSDGQRRRQLPVFFIIAVCGLLLNNFIIFASVEQLRFHYLIGKVLAAAIVLFWNFFGNKYLTFRIK